MCVCEMEREKDWMCCARQRRYIFCEIETERLDMLCEIRDGDWVCGV